MRPKSKPRQINPDTLVFIRHIVVGVLIIGFTAAIVAGVWYGTRIESLTLTKVTVSGGETINHDAVRERVAQQLEGSYFGLVPKQFAWLYPEEKVLASVQAIDRVYGVKINRVSGRELQVSFDEYVPTALWCESITTESCLFLSEKSYAFAAAPRLSGGNFLRFITIDHPPVLHEYLFDEASIDETVRLVELLEGVNWFISHVEVGQEGDLFLLVVGGGELKINLEQSAEETVENLLTILSSEEFKHLKPGNFQYVDLRFGEKVFVNEAEEVSEETLVPEAASSSVEVEPELPVSEEE